MHPFRSTRWSRAEPGAPRACLIAGAAGLALAFGSPGAWAQAQPAPAAPTAPGPASAAPADPAEPVVVTASGPERRPFGTPYAAGPVDGDRRRRVFSVRFLGDDIRHAPRSWRTPPPFDGLAYELPAGAPMAPPLFPPLWPPAA